MCVHSPVYIKIAMNLFLGVVYVSSLNFDSFTGDFTSSKLTGRLWLPRNVLFPLLFPISLPLAGNLRESLLIFNQLCVLNSMNFIYPLGTSCVQNISAL